MNMKWHIKEFNELDLEELYNIIKERTNVFVVEQDCPYPECDDKDKKAYHLYLTNNNEIISYLRILSPGVSYENTSIGRVLVKKEYRKRGIAKELMKRAIKFIENDLREDSITISAQQYLIKFYTDIGFKVVSEGYLEDGIPHVKMIYKK